MLVNYNINKLKGIMDDLYAMTGINFAITDTNFHFLYRCNDEPAFCTVIQNTVLGKNKCLCSDTNILESCRENCAFQSHICHAGLKDAATPIIKNGVIVGYILMGQIRTSDSIDDVLKNLSWLKEDIHKITEYYEQLPTFSDMQIDSLSNLLSHILFENAIEIDFNDFITFATAYIKNNISSDLSIPSLCTALHVSKNYLYKRFREDRGCTVNEYINRQRVQHAQKLLRETNDPIYHIAASVGIQNYTYFCRLFKKQTGLSPIGYRNKL